MKQIALYLREVLSNPLFIEYYSEREAMIGDMKNTAIRQDTDNRYQRGVIHGMECELHELKAFVLTHTSTDEDTLETSFKA